MEKKESKKTISIRIPESKYNELKEIAEKSNQTMTNLIIHIIEDGHFICFEEGAAIAELLFELRWDIRDNGMDAVTETLNKLCEMISKLFKKYEEKSD